MSILTLNDVSYKYEGTSKNVLKNLSVSFEAGKVYSIIGKSGAGKSTLLSLISGLDICSKGIITYKGINIKELNRDDYRAKNVGVIFQGFNLLLNLTGIENIVLSMNISKSKEKTKKEYAISLLEKVGIDLETANRKVLKMSGGEQQRVGIARALAHNPDIVIADEPTGNLDAKTEDDILKILKSLAHNEGKCVIIVTHSEKISKNTDEIIRIDKGQLQVLNKKNLNI